MADDDVPSETPAEQTASIQLITCPSCGHLAPPDSRFCSACGASLAAVAGMTASLPVATTSGSLPAVDESLLDQFDPGEAVLVVHRGPNQGARFELLGGELSIGRSPESNIFLDDVTVSRRHASLQRTGETWTITDHESLNGTYVNHNRVDNHALSNGDQVQIGKYRFLFYQAGQ